MSELDPVTVARILVDALEAASIPYAVGGALAYGYWGPPRGTQDVDLNVFLGPDRAEGAFDVLAGAGMSFDRGAARQAVAEGGHVRGFVGRTPVDVFFDSIPLHEAAAARALSRPMLGRPARVLSAEDIVLFKMLFHRPKDLFDVERLVPS